jgi:hypothetical protein
MLDSVHESVCLVFAVVGMHIATTHTHCTHDAKQQRQLTATDVVQ